MTNSEFSPYIIIVAPVSLHSELYASKTRFVSQIQKVAFAANSSIFHKLRINVRLPYLPSFARIILSNIFGVPCTKIPELKGAILWPLF